MSFKVEDIKEGRWFVKRSFTGDKSFVSHAGLIFFADGNTVEYLMLCHDGGLHYGSGNSHEFKPSECNADWFVEDSCPKFKIK